MSLFDKAFYHVFNGKRTITGPIFKKDFEKENKHLRELTALLHTVVSNKRKYIERDIALLKYGLEGEKNLYYELKNSFIPMLCLHDIRLEYKDYVAQFDFILITNKFIYVLESKKLSGDIEINADGDFIRIIKNSNGKVVKKEGMYSPISQNERHVNILREILINEGVIKTLPIKSAVVIANPTTIVNKQKAPIHVQGNIYKYDQVNTLLKNELSDPKNEKDMFEKYMYQIADFLVDHHKTITYDYKAKYSLSNEDLHSGNTTEQVQTDLSLYNALKEYRLQKAREEKIKAYMVFTNEMLDLLTQIRPVTKKELLSIKGFGNKKVEQYGEEILSIINQ
ncbi:HRDC domain-containing protein [Bacillus tuaregi]|uniref:HRDC domain-containing protein n=1 Tax=Bacillus tuaregi TaxID=1816695 RepID=UPI0008F84E2A|nr:HRDC domain-containing protein [Bacillus tuaregi]